MIAFPEWFVTALIWLALIWTGAGVVVLIGMIVKDWKDKSVW
jgi:hypothetical protein